MAGIQTLPAPYCPECGSIMKLRRPKKHQPWEPFWGCGIYPECEGTRNIGPDGKAEALDDEDDPYDNLPF
jgi:ssDNA-binding Zn-finger/Zn-ribbon topoisomerase 1